MFHCGCKDRQIKQGTYALLGVALNFVNSLFYAYSGRLFGLLFECELILGAGLSLQVLAPTATANGAAGFSLQSLPG
jgi:hypothetical protein